MPLARDVKVGDHIIHGGQGMKVTHIVPCNCQSWPRMGEPDRLHFGGRGTEYCFRPERTFLMLERRPRWEVVTMADLRIGDRLPSGTLTAIERDAYRVSITVDGFTVGPYLPDAPVQRCR